ncbi:MAG: outer membrane beta-barrel protein [Devosia sp.]
MLKKSLMVATLLTGLVVGPAQAADLFIPEVIVDPVALTWSGCYIGADIRANTGRTSETFPYSDYATNITGPGIAPQIGCDYQLEDSPFLVGIVADVAALNDRGDNIVVPGAFPQRLTSSLDWLASVRARAGYVADKTLFYATAGIAFGNVTTRLEVVGGALDATSNVTQVGYTVGGGIETLVTDNISVFAEYNYTDLGRSTHTFAGAAGLRGPAGNELDLLTVNHTVKVGVNYRF